MESLRVLSRFGFALILLTSCFVRRSSSADDGSPGYGVKRVGAATYFGGGDGGACGYGTLAGSVYTKIIASGSPGLYKDGEGCGACYRIKCVNSKLCKSASIVVPITDSCHGCNACGSNCEHFDLSEPAFDLIAERASGIIQLEYERVPCQRSGNIKFHVSGSPYWLNVHLRNAAGPGDIDTIYVKPSNGDWIEMQRDWGSNWIYSGFLQAPLNFKIRARLDGQEVSTQRCLPLNWQTGVYDCGVQFSSPLPSNTKKKSPPPNRKRNPPKRSKPPRKIKPGPKPRSPPKRL